ncbi:putative AMP-binding protein, partial [Alcaligenes faecalis subsp. faecalis NCIB 8687]
MLTVTNYVMYFAPLGVFAAVANIITTEGLGVSIVPINPDLRAAELEYLIGHSEMIMAIALPSRHQDLVETVVRLWIGHF